jgi:hypothetical protein
MGRQQTVNKQRSTKRFRRKFMINCKVNVLPLQTKNSKNDELQG